MLSYAFIDGFTRVDRYEAIARLKSAVAEVDGVIADFAFFSTEAIRLTVTVDGGSLHRLRALVEESGVELFDKCAAELAKAENTLSPTKPVSVLLHVTFLLEEPDAAADAARV